MDSDKVSTSGNENRKSAKPIMEKKRRARINASLAELKSLLLEVIKKEGQRHSKMEKADILEMTVNHLRQLQRSQFSAPTGSDPTILNKYRLGFNECATEVSRYLSSMDGIDVDLRARLLNHLANCMTASTSTTSSRPHETSTASPSVTSTTPAIICRKVEQSSPAITSQQPDNVSSGLLSNHTTLSPQTNQIILSPTVSTQVLTKPSIIAGPSGGVVLAPKPHVPTPTVVTDNSSKFTPLQPAPATNVQMNNTVNGLQIVPTKMPSGEIALVLPANVFGGAQIPNYVIPVYASGSSLSVANVMTLGGAASAATTTSAPVLAPTLAPASVPVPTLQNNQPSLTITNLPKGYKLVPCSTTTRPDEPTTTFSLSNTLVHAPATATVSIPPLLTLPSHSPSRSFRFGNNESDGASNNLRNPGDFIQGHIVEAQDENVWRPW